jgi:hypothetical protein
MNISRLPGERAEETVQGIAAAQLMVRVYQPS